MLLSPSFPVVSGRSEACHVTFSQERGAPCHLKFATTESHAGFLLSLRPLVFSFGRRAHWVWGVCSLFPPLRGLAVAAGWSVLRSTRCCHLHSPPALLCSALETGSFASVVCRAFESVCPVFNLTSSCLKVFQKHFRALKSGATQFLLTSDYRQRICQFSLLFDSLLFPTLCK